ncbi:MAG: hypothetical protein RL322_3108 [Pseudomonadota bacterium]
MLCSRPRSECLTTGSDSASLTDVGRLLGTLRESGARACHEARVLRLWTQARPWDSPRKRSADCLPAALDRALPAIIRSLDGLADIRLRQSAADGGERLLIGLHDGQSVEAVLLPRGGVCVSTQVGCAVGCVFCMTGQGGLIRQLGSAEIVAQVVAARRLRPVRKVVFMGMGEPAHNLDAVFEAIELLATHGDIGQKNLVLSTVGDWRVFDRLSIAVIKPALALSLHSTQPALRESLLPRAPRIDPADLVEAADRYARQSGYPVQYQWTLIEGLNDGEAEIEGIVRLLSGRYAVMNLIPYNPVAGLNFRRPHWSHAAAMARQLHRRGILTKIRHSAAQEVEGGCGQLRARALTG